MASLLRACVLPLSAMVRCIIERDDGRWAETVNSEQNEKKRGKPRNKYVLAASVTVAIYA